VIDREIYIREKKWWNIRNLREVMRERENGGNAFSFLRDE
jgi:uncharacterized protein YtpQ (UPF0354 family)